MKLLLKIKYDGTNYAGYQVQENAPTIQAELNSALFDLFGCECDVTGLENDRDYEFYVESGDQ